MPNQPQTPDLTPTTPQERAEWLRLSELATPLPWTLWIGNATLYAGLAERNTPGSYAPATHEICRCEDARDEWEADELEPANHDNAAYLAAAANALPRLVAEVEALEVKHKARIQEILHDLKEAYGEGDWLNIHLLIQDLIAHDA